MILLKTNWYEFDHDAVAKRFSGGLSFCNDFCVLGEYQPSAVYRAATPDKSKGHKKYMLITKTDSGFVVRGMSPQKIQQFRYQAAVHCLGCDNVVYSINRHDFRSCTCGNVSIDGGKDYFKVSYKPNTQHKRVVIDLLTDVITDPIPTNGKIRKKEAKAPKETQAKKANSASKSQTRI